MSGKSRFIGAVRRDQGRGTNSFPQSGQAGQARSGAPWAIDEEIGDFAAAYPPFGRLFRFFRYDAQLEIIWLADKLGLAVAPRQLEKLEASINGAPTSI